MYDRAYPRNIGINRGTNLTLFDYYDNHENGLYLYPLSPGDNLLDETFHYTVLNPVARVIRRQNRRGRWINWYRRKLTCREANDTRLATMIRWIVEVAFAALQQYQILKGFIDQQFLGVSNMYAAHQKLEILFNNACGMHNRNHQEIKRDVQSILPPGVTETDFGHMIRFRRRLENELCPYSNVQFSDNFKSMPTLNAMRGWTPSFPGDPMMGFPVFAWVLMFFLCMGKYNAKCGTQIIGQITAKEERDFHRQNPDFNIDWAQFHANCSRLPNNVLVWWKDEVTRPGNWNDQYHGEWFERRLAILQVPSRHKNTNFKVVLQFIPTDRPLKAGFKNRLGFTQDGLNRLLGYACVDEGCRAGSRLLGACGHVCAAVSYLAVFAQTPHLFQSSHSNKNIFSTQKAKSLNLELLD